MKYKLTLLWKAALLSLLSLPTFANIDAGVTFCQNLGPGGPNTGNGACGYDECRGKNCPSTSCSSGETCRSDDNSKICTTDKGYYNIPSLVDDITVGDKQYKLSSKCLTSCTVSSATDKDSYKYCGSDCSSYQKITYEEGGINVGGTSYKSNCLTSCTVDNATDKGNYTSKTACDTQVNVALTNSQPVPDLIVNAAINACLSNSNIAGCSTLISTAQTKMTADTTSSVITNVADFCSKEPNKSKPECTTFNTAFIQKIESLAKADTNAINTEITKIVKACAENSSGTNCPSNFGITYNNELSKITKERVTSRFVFPPIDGLSALYLANSDVVSLPEMFSVKVKADRVTLEEPIPYSGKTITKAEVINHKMVLSGTDGKTIDIPNIDSVFQQLDNTYKTDHLYTFKWITDEKSNCGVSIGLNSNNPDIAKFNAKGFVCALDLKTTEKFLVVAFDEKLGKVEVKAGSNLLTPIVDAVGNKVYQTAEKELSLTATSNNGKTSIITGCKVSGDKVDMSNNEVCTVYFGTKLKFTFDKTKGDISVTSIPPSKLVQLSENNYFTVLDEVTLNVTKGTATEIKCTPTIPMPFANPLKLSGTEQSCEITF